MSFKCYSKKVKAAFFCAAIACRLYALEEPVPGSQTMPKAEAETIATGQKMAEASDKSQVGVEAFTRPLRLLKIDYPEPNHHAGEERYSFDFPYGEEVFEKFRAAYLTNGGKAWIEAVFERSKPYASYIYERIHYHGLPEELFFLPFIESEYSSKAVSKSGAVGLWQFMRNSIAGYGMKIDEWLDERRDFKKATDGALRKLKDNYARYGDWLLALAAYNSGAGAIDRAIKSGGVKDYWSLRDKGLLSRETSSYIPKFLALVSVAKYGGRNEIKPSWTKALEWEDIKVSRPVDLGMLAELSSTALDLLKAGNSELNYGVTPPDGNYYLKVPRSSSEAVKQALDSNERLVNVYIHTVGSGDTVSALARHYGVPVSLVTRMNPGLNPDLIRLGQRLAIPAFKETSPYKAEHADTGKLVFGASYTVVKGDTLWSISLKYGVQPEVLAEHNKMNLDSLLHEGMTLLVPIME